MKLFSSRFLPLIATLALTPMAFAADVVTVATVTAAGSTVDVPVSIRDSPGTSLGVDQPAGSRIQSYSIKVTYAPAASVQSITFSRAGITSSLTPTSEFTPSSTGAVSLLDTFKESTNPIPFTLTSSGSGNQVAHLTVTLSPSAAPNSTITLTLDPSLTQLTDDGGNAATKETSGNSRLSLVNGAIHIPQISLNLSPSSSSVSVGGTRVNTVTASSAVPSATTVTLSSSDTGKVTVPASVVIPAGGTHVDFVVHGVAVGSSTITATLPASLGSGSDTQTVSVSVAPPQCTVPAMPQVLVPAGAQVGTTYTVAWGAVSGATEYVIDEATDSAFADASSRTLTTTSADYSHATAGTFYYRVVARNSSGSCSTSSAPGFGSVAVTDAPPVPQPTYRYLPVVGSAAGAFGAHFKTSVELFNPKDVTITGKIVYHPQGTSAAAGDPSITYSVEPKKTTLFADLLPAMNASGVGSADLVADPDMAVPVSLVRVFNDAGVLGTTGLAEELMSEGQALKANETAALIAPSDILQFRLNVGVRTLGAGATMTITVTDHDGVVVASVNRSYPVSYFIQVTSAVFLDGYALKGGETISITMTGGSAFIYGSTTDNVTNDPSVQFANRIE